jgi:hypothetical protein
MIRKRPETLTVELGFVFARPRKNVNSSIHPAEEKPMWRASCLLGVACVLGPVAAEATPITVTGQATVVAPPASASAHTGSVGWVFQEQTGIVPVDLSVDVTGTPGTYTDVSPGIIAAGTAITSFYYHSFGPDTGGDIFSGSITFPTPILGVEALATSLVNTNGAGAPGTTYLTTNSGQGFDFATPPMQIDQVTISPDRLTLTFLNETFSAPDDLRIFTAAAVPEPATLLLVGTGLFAVRRRFRTRRRK